MRFRARTNELYSFAVRLSIVCAACCLVVSLAPSARAEALLEPTTGISITVTRDGTYVIHSATPQWTFSGSVAGGVANIAAGSGQDGAGAFREIVFDERTEPSRHFSIRTWPSRPGVLFTEVMPQESCENPPPFPNFSTFPTFPHNLSFAGTWCAAHYDLRGKEGPWVFFNDAAETAVLSPAANFMVAKLNVTANGAIQSRIDAAIPTLPQSLSHATLLVLERGINRGFDSWGHLLTDIQGKVRPSNDADATLKYLGYWTDNGAAYYYNFDPARGYEGTLLGIRDDFQRMGLPLGYMQLDSWWYRKGETGDWNPLPDQWNFGINTYEAHPDLFPRGLASFRARLGLPLVTHARWIDVKSPYRTKYTISNNVAVDPRYWNEIAGYLQQSGVATYEQDWLDSRATADFKLSDQTAFMDNMAHAFASKGITMEYCMPTPRHVLQGSKYSNLTTVRVSDDRFERSFWPQIIYASRLATSIGAWPWVDVFASGETANLMIATLSAGVVGASDAIGAADARNLGRAARPDGILVKPDAPLVPSDSTFLADSQNGAGAMVAYTYSDHEAGRAVYAVAFRRAGDTEAVFSPSEAGLAGSLYAFDMRSRSGMRVDASAPITFDVSDDWSYILLVPVSRGGVAVIGDLGKFAPRGRARISAIADHVSSTDVEVAFAPDEKRVVITGYSESGPEVTATAGSVSNLSWSGATHLFTVAVSPAEDGGNARITISASAPRHRGVGSR